MPAPIRVGIIGCGTATQLLHLPALSQMPDRFAATAICDVSPSVLRGVGEAWSIARRFAEPEALIASADIDAVLIASPHVHHAEAGCAAMAAGKHVLIEKPHCLTIEEADLLIAAQQRAGVVALVGYMRRYAPAFLAAKSLIGPAAAIRHARVQDVIGSNALIVDSTSRVIRGDDIPAAIAARTRDLQAERIARAIGAAPPALATAYMMLLGLASHDLSAMRELIGPPQRVLFATHRWEGRFISAAFDYGSFVCDFVAGVDQVGRMDAFIAVNGGDRTVRVEYDTPFVRNLPTRLVVTEADSRVGVRHSESFPTRQDSFVLEWQAFHEAVTTGQQPKTSLADAREDIAQIAAIVERMR